MTVDLVETNALSLGDNREAEVGHVTPEGPPSPCTPRAPLLHDPVDKVIAALDRSGCHPRPSGSSWSAKCPAHEDKNPSLSFGKGVDGRVLVKCHAGCLVETVVARLGLSLSDLFPESPQPTRKSIIDRVYDYVDADGALRYQVVRYSPKGFSQRRPDGRGGWISDLKGVERLPYRLPELLKGVAGDDWVFVVEGEKDVDCLASKGLVSTCNSGGAGKFPFSHASFFSGAQVAILPDNDQPGHQQAEQVASILQRSAREVRIVELPGLGHQEDVSDWFNKGGTVDELVRLISEAGTWSPAGETPAAADGDTKPQDPFADSTRRPVSICMADVVPEHVRWLWNPRIPLGKVTVFDGDPDVGKSTVTIDLSARVSNGCPLPDGTRSDLEGPAEVILVSAEDGAGDTIRPRLDAAGAAVERIHLLTEVDYVDDNDCLRRHPWTMQDLDVLKLLVLEHRAQLVVIDPLMAFLPSSVNSYSDQDVRGALAPLARLAEETGAAVVLVRHLNKAGGGNALYRGGGSIGIIGAARSALLFAKDPSDPSGNRKVMAREKGNLAPAWISLAYELVPSEEHGCARVRWLGESAQTAATLLAVPVSNEEVSAIDKAAAFLRETLADGPVAQKQIVDEGRKIGISEKTLQRAKKDLYVRSRKLGLGGWAWELPPEDGQGANDGQVGQVGHLQHDQEIRADEGGQTLEGGHFEAEAMFNPLVLHCEVCEQVILGDDRQTGLPWHESCRPEPTPEELDTEQSEEVWT
jgi:hypothetical protein